MEKRRRGISEEEFFRLKKLVLDDLVKRGRFWSYDLEKISIDIDDDILCEKSLIFSDIDMLPHLFGAYERDYLEGLWRKHILPQYNSMQVVNNFLAYVVFHVKDITKYAKAHKVNIV